MFSNMNYVLLHIYAIQADLTRHFKTNKSLLKWDPKIKPFLFFLFLSPSPIVILITVASFISFYVSN